MENFAQCSSDWNNGIILYICMNILNLGQPLKYLQHCASDHDAENQGKCWNFNQAQSRFGKGHSAWTCEIKHFIKVQTPIIVEWFEGFLTYKFREWLVMMSDSNGEIYMGAQGRTFYCSFGNQGNLYLDILLLKTWKSKLSRYYWAQRVCIFT